MAALARRVTNTAAGRVVAASCLVLAGLTGCLPGTRTPVRTGAGAPAKAAVYAVRANPELRPVTQNGIGTNGANASVCVEDGRVVRFEAQEAQYLSFSDGKRQWRFFDSMDRVSVQFELDSAGMKGVTAFPRAGLLILWTESVAGGIRLDGKALPLADFISEPTLGQIRISVPRGRHALALTFQPKDPDAKKGWPLGLDYSYTASPAIADISGDGTPEILVGAGRTNQNMLAIQPDGSFLKGWPQGTPNEIPSSPAVGDIDGDGKAEIVVGSYGNFDPKERLHEGWVYAWEADGQPVKGWPIRAGWGIESTPALADLDRDGRLDIVIGSTDGRVYAWRGDGSPLPGWPQEAGSIVTSSPAVGDLDGDGVLEVVVGQGDGKICAWSGDGKPKPGWPVSTGLSIESSPALCDLDRDGRLDVLVGSNDGSVYALTAAGKPLPGWPQSTGDIVRSSPAVGDLDADGRPEVVVGSYDRKVYVWHADGRLAKGWPQRTGWLVKSSPVLADIGGDARPEIIIGSHDSRLWAWQADGTPVPGWPKTTLMMNMASAAVGDIDRDGLAEIVSGAFNVYHGKLFCWESKARWDPRSSPWPMFRGNPQRTGCLPLAGAGPR